MHSNFGRTSVFIDKFSATFSVPNDDRNWHNSAEALSHLCQQGLFLFPARGDRVYEHYHAAWNAVFTLPNGTSAKCLIQVFPKSIGKGFLRLEWNPAKLQTAQFRQVREILAHCIPNIDDWWRTAKVTRADITIDLHNISISRLLTFSASAATIGIKKKENAGRLNSYILGSENSTKRLTIYDKAFERSVRRESRNAQSVKRIYRCCTRIEFRIRKIGSISDMAKSKNPLIGFSVISVQAAYDYQGTEEWQRFVRRAESVGAQSALTALADRKRRQRYRDILNNHCTPHWYDREQLWEEAKQKINSLIVLD